MSHNPRNDEATLQGWDLDTHLNTPWTAMSVPEIAQFLQWHPTYLMGAKEASDWWAGVDAGIRRYKARYDAENLPSDYRYVGGRLYYQNTLVSKDKD